MAHDIDPTLQRSIENANQALSDEIVPQYIFSQAQFRAGQGRFEEEPRWPFIGGGNDLGWISLYSSTVNYCLITYEYPDSYNYDLSNVPVALAKSGSRLSLVTWTSQRQQDGERDMLINPAQLYSFAQNQGRSQAVSRDATMPNNADQEGVLDQLATSMLLQRPMPQASPEPARIFSNSYGNRINQLQPQIQQATPPFNLSESTYLLRLAQLIRLTRWIRAHS